MSEAQHEDAVHAEGMDPLMSVRRHPEWFFRSKHFETHTAVGGLVAEAGRGGARTIQVATEDEWIIVTADADWLDGDVAAFTSPQLDPRGGPNSTRFEVALVAFCQAVVTAAPGDRVRSWPEGMAGSVPNDWFTTTGRIIAFVPPEEPHREPPPVSARRRPRLRLLPTGEEDISRAIVSFMEKERGLSG